MGTGMQTCLLSGQASSGLGLQGQLLAATAASPFSLPSVFWTVATPLPCPSQETALAWRINPAHPDKAGIQSLQVWRWKGSSEEQSHKSISLKWAAALPGHSQAWRSDRCPPPKHSDPTLVHLSLLNIASWDEGSQAQCD